MNKFYVNNNLNDLLGKDFTPRRSTKHSAGYDFFATENYLIPAHSSILIDSNVSCELNDDCVLLLYIRSSYAYKYGIQLVNNVGVIDADFYPNTIKAKLINTSDDDFVINVGDKFMQGIITKFEVADDEIISEKERNSGIGSTGK